MKKIKTWFDRAFKFNRDWRGNLINYSLFWDELTKAHHILIHKIIDEDTRKVPTISGTFYFFDRLYRKSIYQDYSWDIELRIALQLYQCLAAIYRAIQDWENFEIDPIWLENVESLTRHLNERILPQLIDQDRFIFDYICVDIYKDINKISINDSIYDRLEDVDFFIKRFNERIENEQ